MFQSFSPIFNDGTTEYLFFGNPVNVARYDQQKYPVFERAAEKQISFFWRPEEVNLSLDSKDFQDLSPAEKHIFTSNLKYQSLLDSIQGRCPSVAFMPIVSDGSMEGFIAWWTAMENIHARSYTHIIRNIYPNPSVIFDDITFNEAIKKRAADVSRYYDDLIHAVNLYHSVGLGEHVINGEKVVVSLRDIKKKLLLCMVSVNALEALRFYVSFCCTFAFAERKKMIGNAHILRMIAKDENLHKATTFGVLNLWRLGKDDPEMQEIFEECKNEILSIYIAVAEQEKEWCDYLFQDGSMIGLNAGILKQYVEFLTNQALTTIGFEPSYPTRTNPVPWINTYLESDKVQTANQETEGNYLTGQIDGNVDLGEFDDISL